jgi:hypothetical protein
MQCIIILPDEDNRLPTAQQLRQAGFRVSTAVAVTPRDQEGTHGQRAPHRGMAVALAAEEHAPYPTPQESPGGPHS